MDRILRRVSCVCRAIFGGVICLFCLLAGITTGKAHDWYDGLTSPRGIDCCGGRDCRPVPYRLNANGHEEIEANGRWWPIEYDKVLTLPTPDNQAHACWRNPRGKPDFRCIILPGMADLEQNGLTVDAAIVAARR